MNFRWVSFPFEEGLRKFCYVEMERFEFRYKPRAIVEMKKVVFHRTKETAASYNRRRVRSDAKWNYREKSRGLKRMKEDERFVTLRSVGLPSDTKPIITNYNTSDIQDPPHECSIVSIPPPPFLEETIRGSRSPLLGTKDTRVEKCSCQSYDTSPLGQV